jgi:hypothetical protein
MATPPKFRTQPLRTYLISQKIQTPAFSTSPGPLAHPNCYQVQWKTGHAVPGRAMKGSRRSPPHTPCAPKLLPNRSDHPNCQRISKPYAIQVPLANSIKSSAVQERLLWLHDNSTSHLRRNISAWRGIVITPRGVFLNVEYADQLLHASDIVCLVRSPCVVLPRRSRIRSPNSG